MDHKKLRMSEFFVCGLLSLLWGQGLLFAESSTIQAELSWKIERNESYLGAASYVYTEGEFACGNYAYVGGSGNSRGAVYFIANGVSMMRCASINSIELHYDRSYADGNNTVSIVGLGNWVPVPGAASPAYAYLGSSSPTAYGTHALGNTTGWKVKALPSAACQDLESILSQESGGMLFGLGFLSTDVVAKFFGYASSYKPYIVVNYTPFVAKNLTATQNQRDGILLEWEDPATDLPAYYNIYRRTSTGTFQILDRTLGSSVNSYLDESANPEVTYYYCIKAERATGALGPESTQAQGYRLKAYTLDTWDRGDDSSSGATTLTPTTSLQTHGPHSLSEYSLDEHDWFKFYLQSGYTYVFEATSGGVPVDTWAELYDSSMNYRTSGDSGGADGNFRIQFQAVASGWYYLKVGARFGFMYEDPGIYTLRYQTTTVPTTTTTSTTRSTTIPSTTSTTLSTTIPSTTSTISTTIPSTTSTTRSTTSTSASTTTTTVPANDAWDPGDDTGGGATTVTPTTTEQPHGPHTLSGTDDYDWFKVYLSAGYWYNFNTIGGSGDNYGELYSDTGGINQVAYNDDGGGNAQFTFNYSPSVTGWYYLRVRAFSAGSPCSYNLKHRVVSGPSTTTTVPTTTTTSRTTTSTSRSTTSTSRTTTSASTTSTSRTTTTIPGGYLCDPADGAALATACSFDGYFYDEKAYCGEGSAMAVRGTLNVKVTKLAGALTAKAVLQTGALSFRAKTWTATEPDGTFRAILATWGGETLDLRVRQDRVWGTLAGGKLGGETLTLDGSRNRFADSRDAGAQALLNAFKGYYTVSLPVFDGICSETAPRGVGYLAVTVGAKGSAKIAGVLADGTKVTQSSRLILFDGCGPEACVPFFVPLYAKHGWAGGLLWVTPNRGTVVTDRDLGWFIQWENPSTGLDGFSMLLDACGGFYGTGAALAAAYSFNADAAYVQYYHSDVWEEPVAAPGGVPVAAAGGRMTITKGVMPRKVIEGGDVWYKYDEVNPACATLTFTAKTGLFKGKFSLYYDYADASGRLVHKAVNVPYAGVLTPVRDGAFAELSAGLGYSVVPDNDPALKAYHLKRSYPVRLDAEP